MGKISTGVCNHSEEGYGNVFARGEDRETAHTGTGQNSNAGVVNNTKPTRTKMGIVRGLMIVYIS